VLSVFYVPILSEIRLDMPIPIHMMNISYSIVEKVMTKIKIQDLPRDKKITKAEMKMVKGGIGYNPMAMGTYPFAKLRLRPTKLGGAYNAPHFTLRKAELD
jgi:hypothetical protein